MMLQAGGNLPTGRRVPSSPWAARRRGGKTTAAATTTTTTMQESIKYVSSSTSDLSYCRRHPILDCSSPLFVLLIAAAAIAISPVTGQGPTAAPVTSAAPVPVVAAPTASPTPQQPPTPPILNRWIDVPENPNYQGRHECSFVQAGMYFLLMGGRENSKVVSRYKFSTNTWSRGADAPKEFNHFQALNYQGLIWVLGAFNNNNFPNESPESNVWVYDPAINVWIQGPAIPANRRRGGAGLVMYQDQLYVVGGNTKGHNGGSVRWFDRYDPRTNAWTVLKDAPHRRDHFSAQVVNNKLYCIGGRATSEPNVFANEVPYVDVYDFVTATWTTLPAHLPFPRAGTSTASMGGKILVIGGESEYFGDAMARVDAFDPNTGAFHRAASLRHGRHGTQAIVSGPGIIIAAGSPVRGGGSQTYMEAYSRYAPVGVPSTAGTLSAALAGGPVQPNGTATVLTFSHVWGNTGVIVQRIRLTGTDAVDFRLGVSQRTPFLLGRGESIPISVTYMGTKTAGAAVADLTVTYSGGRRTLFFSLFLGGVCQASGTPCTSQDQCCGRACTAPPGVSTRTCRACKRKRFRCSRTSECCPGLQCRGRRCAAAA